MPITHMLSIEKSNYKVQTKEEKEEKKRKVAEAKKEFVEKIIASAKEDQHFPWQEPNFLNFPKSLAKLEEIDKFNEKNPNTPKDRNEAIYKGANLICLSMITKERGYTDNRWATFNKIKEKGGRVIKGEKGTHISVYKKEGKIRKELDPETGKWKIVYKKTQDGGFILGKNGKKVPEMDPIYTTEVVFNICQTEGLNLKPEPGLLEIDSKDRCEKMDIIIANSEAPVKHDQHTGTGRYYSPILDEVHVPPVELFKSMSAYYATVAHEIGHSTGHEKRCDRNLTGTFGSDSYAREEMVAELTAVFLSRELGVRIPPKELDSHAEYIRGWDQNIKTLTEKPEELYAIIKDAEKATEYIKTHMLEKTLKQQKSVEAVNQQSQIATKEVAEVAQRPNPKVNVVKRHSSSKTRAARGGVSR